MWLHLLILSIILVIVAGLNLFFFILKRQKGKKEEQIYFMGLFIGFILSGTVRFISAILEADNSEINMGVSTLVTVFLLASGFALMKQLKFAKIISIIGGLIAIIYSLGVIIGLFSMLNIADQMFSIMAAISGIFSISTSIILGYFFFKTKISPLLGLFIGIALPTIVFILSFAFPTVLTDIVIVYMLIFVNIVIYLGFQNKLNFFD